MRLNLAPEDNQASQRSKRRRQVATSIGALVCAVSLGVVVVSVLVLGSQKVFLSALNTDVKNSQAKVAGYTNLEAAATAQQQLTTWAQLAGSQGQFSQFFQVLQEFAPQGVAATSISVDDNNNLTMSGTANSYSLVTKFADALQASNVQIGPGHAATNQPYFTNVQLSGVNSSSSGGGSVGFQLTTTMSSQVTNGQ